MAERKATTKSKGRKREKKSVPRGRAYVQSTFNNTLITLTDPNGNVLSWASAGTVGLQGLAQEHAVRRADRGRAARRGARWSTACARSKCS